MRTPEGTLAWASCASAAVLCLVTLAMFPPMATAASGAAAQLQQALAAMAAVPYAVVGALIVWHRPRNRIGWLIVMLGLAASLAVFAAGYARTGLQAADALEVVGGLGWAIAITLVVLLIVLFPTGQPASPRWRPLVWLAVAWALVAVVGGLMFGPSEAAPPVLLIAISACAVAAVVSQFVRFLRSTGDERQQLKWFAYAALIFFALATVGISRVLGNDWSGSVATAALYVLPLGIAVAILRHRLYDIDVLISRTFVYGALTAILAGLYAASIRLFNVLFVGATGEGSEEALVITTLILATTFTPIKRRLEALVERRYHEPVEAPESAASGSEAGSDVRVELRELADRLARVEDILGSPASDSARETAGDSALAADLEATNERIRRVVREELAKVSKSHRA
jgi:hypothetical protein